MTRVITEVREKGLEPSRPKAQEPKSCVYTNFTTPAGLLIVPAGSMGNGCWMPK
jgi:hypothetical protein